MTINDINEIRVGSSCFYNDSIEWLEKNLQDLRDIFLTGEKTAGFIEFGRASSLTTVDRNVSSYKERIEDINELSDEEKVFYEYFINYRDSVNEIFDEAIFKNCI